MNALAKKLLMKPNSRWLLFNVPANYLESLNPLPDDLEIVFNTDGIFHGIQLFVTDSTALATDLQIISPLLKADTVFWIIYPKKNSGIKTDLEMMGSWDAATQYGLRPVASAAVNEVWTALRFRPIEQVKVSAGRNDAVRSNEYSAYIDVDNKTVTLPPDAKTVLEQHQKHLPGFSSWLIVIKKNMYCGY
jgi:hypothetical protein